MSIVNESLMTLGEAAKSLPGRGGRPSLHPATLHRWTSRGVRLPDGRFVKLESARIGGQRMTSREALRRFLEATAGAAPVDQTEIERQLDAIGV